jgi:hypothetical protein
VRRWGRGFHSETVKEGRCACAGGGCRYETRVEFTRGGGCAGHAAVKAALPFDLHACDASARKLFKWQGKGRGSTGVNPCSNTRADGHGTLTSWRSNCCGARMLLTMQLPPRSCCLTSADAAAAAALLMSHLVHVQMAESPKQLAQELLRLC